jgi:hypothetical protein
MARARAQKSRMSVKIAALQTPEPVRRQKWRASARSRARVGIAGTVLRTTTLIAKIGPGQVESFKLTRAQEVSRATVDKALWVLKALSNCSIARGLAVSNPVRRAKLFHEDNSRLRYLTRVFDVGGRAKRGDSSPCHRRQFDRVQAVLSGRVPSTTPLIGENWFFRIRSRNAGAPA